MWAAEAEEAESGRGLGDLERQRVVRHRGDQLRPEPPKGVYGVSVWGFGLRV